MDDMGDLRLLRSGQDPTNFFFSEDLGVVRVVISGTNYIIYIIFFRLIILCICMVFYFCAMIVRL